MLNLRFKQKGVRVFRCTGKGKIHQDHEGPTVPQKDDISPETEIKYHEILQST